MPTRAKAIPAALKRCSRCRGHKTEDQFFTDAGKPRETCNECRVKDVDKRKRRASREKNEREAAALSGKPAPGPPRPMELGISTFSVIEASPKTPKPAAKEAKNNKKPHPPLSQPIPKKAKLSHDSPEAPAAALQKVARSSSKTKRTSSHTLESLQTVIALVPPSKSKTHPLPETSPSPQHSPLIEQEGGHDIDNEYYKEVSGREQNSEENKKITRPAPLAPTQNFFSWGGMSMSAMPKAP